MIMATPPAEQRRSSPGVRRGNAMRPLTVPDLSLVVLVGPSGSGKSTFARRHFLATEVLSSDFCRGLVADDEASQSASGDAFEVLYLIAARRLARGRLTVIDATSVQPDARKPLLALARRYHCPAVAIVFDLPEEVCRENNRQRPARQVQESVIQTHHEQLRRVLPRLEGEGFAPVHVLSSREEMDAAVIVRQPLPSDRRQEPGPFDIVGDVHGCFDELQALLGLLGYAVDGVPAADGGTGYAVRPPAGRKAVFLGDLVDRGPKVPAVLRLVMGMVEAGTALCLTGNHDDKLRRRLRGNPVKVAHGLAETLAQLEQEPPDFRERVRTFLEGLVGHYVLDGGRLVVAHAGMPAHLQGRLSNRVRDFALYGETTGETDEFGLPVRCNWAADYGGPALVVYGHTPVLEPLRQGNTVNIDTGCVFGGRLTALRYPERELVSVPAARTYCPPARPLPAGPPAQTTFGADEPT
jgi:polynucleotide kinase-phosphatase